MYEKRICKIKNKRLNRQKSFQRTMAVAGEFFSCSEIITLYKLSPLSRLGRFLSSFVPFILGKRSEMRRRYSVPTNGRRFSLRCLNG